ncbi:MAG: hypothetical protein LBI47_01915 [Puniceicoccales bacterium]|nr:hypothetical protein [Puniceicoccales bacterium]
MKLKNFDLEIYGGTDYRREELLDGKCNVSLPSCAFDVFFKYHLSRLTNKDNPEIFEVLRQVFVRGDETGFKKKKLDLRNMGKLYNSDAIKEIERIKEKKIEIKKDKNVKSLLMDPEFIRLNKVAKA